VPASAVGVNSNVRPHMKRLLIAIAASAPLAASAEVLDKQPSIAFLLAAAASASFISYSAARRTSGKLALLGLLPVLLFVPALSEQLDPIMRAALASDGGTLYLFCVWLGPTSTVAAFAVGLYRRRKPSSNTAPPAMFFVSASVLGGLGLSTLSGLSAMWACLIVAGALFANGIIAATEDRHA
jgi:hypothetical protein